MGGTSRVWVSLLTVRAMVVMKICPQGLKPGIRLRVYGILRLLSGQALKAAPLSET